MEQARRPRQPAAQAHAFDAEAGASGQSLTATDAAIRFEPDGYHLKGPKLMGRQAAGNAFLRAAVAGRAGDTLWAYTPHKSSAKVFADMVGALDPAVAARWLPAHRLDQLSRIGTLYLPDPELAKAARLRLRARPDAYSLCGVTHTTASHSVMDAIAGLITAPVMPWDALICTSHAVRATVEMVLRAQWEYLRWRLGSPSRPPLPQLPVIPLGVHCSDFDLDANERVAARRALGIADDAIVVLFVGRLAFHAKAHPHAMYVGLKAAAERTGKPLVLVQCGWFAIPKFEHAFKTGASQFCPAVTNLFTDGKDPTARRQSWAAADIFVSLSDNIQETFGLTPIEAMAAGLPVLVTDWDGYKETVRDGQDGYRITTWMPPAGLGNGLAQAYEAGAQTYDLYCGLSCQAVSLDHRQLADRLTALVEDAPLRAQLGAAGRQRAREVFDWSVIYPRYQALWAELAARRTGAADDPAQLARLKAAPRATPARLDPFATFGHYPTARLMPDTRVTAAAGATAAAYKELAGHALFAYAGQMLPPAALVTDLLAALAAQPKTVAELAGATNAKLDRTLVAVSVLAKMGLVSVEV